MQETVIL